MTTSEMWTYLWYEAGKRRRRLFECACCRLVWNELKDVRSRHAVAVAELYADGLETRENLEVAEQAAQDAWDEEIGGALSKGTWDEQTFPYCAAAFNAAVPELGYWGGVPLHQEPHRIILDAAPDMVVMSAAIEPLLRDIVGNPRQATNLDPTWRTSDVVILGTSIYQNRAFDVLPILADALQDAGCENDQILSHLRSDGPHVLGCWALDLVLGKS